MKTKLLTLFLLAGSSMFAGTRFFVGFGVGTGGYRRPYYPPPPPPVVYAPPAYYSAAPYGWVGNRWCGPRPIPYRPYARPWGGARYDRRLRYGSNGWR